MSETMGVAILGTGDVSGEHIKAFQRNPRTRVVAMLSRERARAEAKARDYGVEGCRAYDDYGELLKNDEVRIVSICTAQHLHVEQGVAAAETGRHVVVEKPIANELAGLRALDAAVRDHGVKSVVSFVLRWNPLYRIIQTLLADGMIGNVFYSEFDYFHGVGPSYSIHSWMKKKEYGMSTMLCAGCHAVDGMRWLLGGEAVEVSAFSNRSKANPFDYEYEPNTVAIVKFSGGQVGKIGCTLEAQMPYAFNVLLMGDGGTIRNNQMISRRWPGQTGWATIPTICPDSGAVTHHPFQEMMDHFVDCILNGRESHCNVADAVKTHEVCIAADISAAEDRPVKLPLD